MDLPGTSNSRQVDSITLGNDEYIDSLYGCFRIDNPLGERFAEHRMLEIVPGSGRFTDIHVPEELKWEIPAGMKAAYTDQVQVGHLDQNLGTLFLLSARAGWNQTEEDVARLAEWNPPGFFLATIGAWSSPIHAGTAAVIPLSPGKAWIGMVLVHPELRRQGLATVLLLACLRSSLDHGGVIIGLDATPAGRSVYEAFGFRASFALWRTVFPLQQFGPGGREDAGIFQVQREDMHQLVRYDCERCFDRSHVSEKLAGARSAFSFMSRARGGAITGYCLARDGRQRPFIGPLVGDSEDATRLLLAAASRALRARGNTEACIDSPETAFESAQTAGGETTSPSRHRLLAECRCIRSFLRMYQDVEPAEAERLARSFAEREGLPESHPAAQEAALILRRAGRNSAATRAFMDFEKKTILPGTWGITRPEKG